MKKIVSNIGVIAAILLSASVQAMPLLDQGDVTLDSSTGMEWLDLTLTAGMSYNEVMLTDFVVVDGFRYATKEELDLLYQNAGVFDTGGPDSMPQNYEPAKLLLELMGCTSGLLSSEFACDGIEEDWSWGMYLRSDGTWMSMIDAVHDVNRGIVTTSSFYWGDDSRSWREDVGSFLVRDFPEPISSPSVLGLLILGVISVRVKLSRQK